MTRADARELAVHLIYGREFTGEEPEQVVAVRLQKEYYAELAKENEVYSDRPSRNQLNYIDTVVASCIIALVKREIRLTSQPMEYLRISSFSSSPRAATPATTVSM